QLAGACVHEPSDDLCAPGDACSTETCDAVLGCVTTPTGSLVDVWDFTTNPGLPTNANWMDQSTVLLKGPRLTRMANGDVLAAADMTTYMDYYSGGLWSRRMTPAGVILWERSDDYNFTQTPRLWDVMGLPDGGFLVVGAHRGYMPGTWRFDAEGASVIYTKLDIEHLKPTPPSSPGDPDDWKLDPYCEDGTVFCLDGARWSAIAPLPAGGWVLAGAMPYQPYDDTFNHRAISQVLDSDGNVTEYGPTVDGTLNVGLADDYFLDVVADESGAVFAGAAGSDGRLLRRDLDGTWLWDREYPSAEVGACPDDHKGRLNALVHHGQGDLASVGHCSATPNGQGWTQVDGWLLVTDSDGETLWDRVFGDGEQSGDAEELLQVISVGDDDFYMVGQAAGEGWYLHYRRSVDAVITERRFGPGALTDILTATDGTVDDGLFIAGYDGDDHPLVMLIDADGLVNCTCDGADCQEACAGGCDDGDVCTVDLCDPFTGSCEEEDKSCDDHNPCTDDLGCSTAFGDTGCFHQNNTAPCDDEDACSDDDTCSEGACVPGPPLDCDDGDLCTQD
ncbi:MAG: hypothetical protein VX938_12300, partial [Myxococcota bacterium]|nr:hypothetical protein [Myxococcota bacterium]